MGFQWAIKCVLPHTAEAGDRQKAADANSSSGVDEGGKKGLNVLNGDILVPNSLNDKFLYTCHYILH